MKQLGHEEYYKEDLLWEAVRRNVEYISYYRNVQKRKDSENGETVITEEEKNRWWMIEKRITDPKTDVDTIKNKIKNGERPIAVHPYHSKFKLLKNRSRGAGEINVPDYKPYICEWIEVDAFEGAIIEIRVARLLEHIERLLSKDHIICSINPYADLKDIIPEIKKIREKKAKAIKKRYEHTKSRYFPSVIEKNIKYNIECLLIYDKTINNFISAHSKDKLDIKDGCLIDWLDIIDGCLINKLDIKDDGCLIDWLGIKDGCKDGCLIDKLDIKDGCLVVPERDGFKQYITNISSEEKEQELRKGREDDNIEGTHKRNWKNAYDRAIELIQNAPRNIVFLPGKT